MAANGKVATLVCASTDGPSALHPIAVKENLSLTNQFRGGIKEAEGILWDLKRLGFTGNEQLSCIARSLRMFHLGTKGQGLDHVRLVSPDIMEMYVRGSDGLRTISLTRERIRLIMNAPSLQVLPFVEG